MLRDGDLLPHEWQVRDNRHHNHHHHHRRLGYCTRMNLLLLGQESEGMTKQPVACLGCVVLPGFQQGGLLLDSESLKSKRSPYSRLSRAQLLGSRTSVRPSVAERCCLRIIQIVPAAPMLTKRQVLATVVSSILITLPVYLGRAATRIKQLRSGTTYLNPILTRKWYLTYGVAFAGPF